MKARKSKRTKPARPEPKKKPERVKCPDCGLSYQLGQPHTMFCAAHTCSECGTSFSHVVPIYDSREKPPIRLCDGCLTERLDADEEEDEE